MTEFDTSGSFEWLGVRYRTLLSPEETGGAMSVVDSLSPAGSGPPRHIHHAEDETFVNLSGRIELWVDGEASELGPGASAFVPRGTEHTFRVVGNEPSRHLIILTPGGFERFFVAMSEGGFRIPEDMGAIEASAARHNLSFTGPPLGHE